MNDHPSILSSRIIAYLAGSVLAVISVVVYMAHASEPTDGGVAPLFGLELPPGHPDWRLISVAHEAPTTRSSKPAIPATSLSKLGTSSSRATHRD